jgi:hypothetical protein
VSVPESVSLRWGEIGVGVMTVDGTIQVDLSRPVDVVLDRFLLISMGRSVDVVSAG